MEGSRRGDEGVNEDFMSGSGVRRLEMDNTSMAYERVRLCGKLGEAKGGRS